MGNGFQAHSDKISPGDLREMKGLGRQAGWNTHADQFILNVVWIESLPAGDYLRESEHRFFGGHTFFLSIKHTAIGSFVDLAAEQEFLDVIPGQLACFVNRSVKVFGIDALNCAVFVEDGDFSGNVLAARVITGFPPAE